MSRNIIISAAAVILMSLVFVPSAIYSLSTGDQLTATVTDKERVCESGKDGACKWMILTDKMSFENTDTIWHWKFNSTDVQSSVNVGETYNFDYYGWRLPFFSIYPNLVGTSKVE